MTNAARRRPRRLTRRRLACATGGGGTPPQQPPGRRRPLPRVLVALMLALPLVAQEAYQETIDVVRYIVPARVIDHDGRAIRGLTAADFTAAIGGKTAAVESVEWIGS